MCYSVLIFLLVTEISLNKCTRALLLMFWVCVCVCVIHHTLSLITLFISFSILLGNNNYGYVQCSFDVHPSMCFLWQWSISLSVGLLIKVCISPLHVSVITSVNCNCVCVCFSILKANMYFFVQICTVYLLYIFCNVHCKYVVLWCCIVLFD